MNVGDYETGPAPRLTISINTSSRVRLADNSWIKLVGMYVDSSEIDRIEARNRSASFYEIVPGRYVLLVLEGEKLACARPIEIVELPARIELSLSANECSAGAGSGVKRLDPASSVR